MFNQNLTLLFGTFGAWKTYIWVREAKKAFDNGDIVISNTWLSFPHIRFYVPTDLPKILREISEYHTKNITPTVAPLSYLISHKIEKSDVEPRNFFVLIDEGGLFFNARNFQKNFADDTITEMLVQPRKYGMQIVAVVQDLQMIDKYFRLLAQEIIEIQPFLFGFARRAYSYDKKYIQNEGGWTPETPTIESSIYWHWFNTRKDRIKYFGGLYYTREILGSKSIRYDHDIFSLSDYLLLESQGKLIDNSFNLLTWSIKTLESKIL